MVPLRFTGLIPECLVIFYRLILRCEDYKIHIVILRLSDSSRSTLDPNTANKHLCVSERNTLVTYSEDAQLYPDHAERFDDH